MNKKIIKYILFRSCHGLAIYFKTFLLIFKLYSKNKD